MGVMVGTVWVEKNDLDACTGIIGYFWDQCV